MRQVAGEWFLNALLPVSVGAATLQIEYYRRIIKSRAKAFIVVYAPISFNTVVSFLLLAIVSPLTLSRLSVQFNLGALVGWILLIAAILIVTAVILVYRYWPRVKRAFAQVLTGLKILTYPGLSLRVGMVSVLVILLNSFILWLCACALGVTSLSFINALILFVTSLFVGTIVPVPGGIGAIEATLAVGLAGSGVDLSESVAIILLFRLISFWIPIVPGIFSFRKLGKDRALFESLRRPSLSKP